MMGSWLVASMGISLVMTILLEGSFALIVGIRDKRDLLLLCMVNILTNPAVVLIYHMTAYYTALNIVLVTVVLEGSAIAVEGSYYKAYARTIRHPCLFSAFVNLFSFTIGKLISLII